MSEWGVLVVIFSRLCRQMEPLACQLSSAAHTFRAGIEGNTTAHLVPSDSKQVYDTWRKLNLAFPLLEWSSTHALVVTDWFEGSKKHEMDRNKIVASEEFGAEHIL